MLLPIVAGLARVFAGALLSLRKARRDHADTLLAEALNEATPGPAGGAR